MQVRCGSGTGPPATSSAGFPRSCYFRRHPASPWLAPSAVGLLEDAVDQASLVIEFGSGRSTRWLAIRSARVLSVEHDEEWYRRIKLALEADDIHNVDYRFVGAGSVDESRLYTAPLGEVAPGTVDVVIVDGLHRAACANAAIDLLRPGGSLVVDDAQRYLPSHSRSPGAIPYDSAPSDPAWAAFRYSTRTWEARWVLSGVSDTAFFRKPQSAVS